ncbi:hypothetical protein D4R71_02830 [bacterium]|nr:MAG: hypothetical protein D4R71_02830 [bacterium]
MSEIIIYDNFTKYLKGKTQLLLNLDILNPQSEILKLFLGNYDNSIVKANSKYFKSTKYYYNDKGLIIDHIIVVETESIQLSLINLEKNEKEQGENSKNYDFRKAIWGMNILQVKNIEKGKPLIEKDDLLLYKDEVAGLSCKIVYIFVQEKLVRAKYVFEESHTNKNDYISDFKKLKDLLTKKYGEPFYSQKWKNDLYEDDFQQWGFAVSLGHLVYFAEWSVPRYSIKLILQGENYKIDLQMEYNSKIYDGLEENQREKQQLDNL